MNPYIVGRPAKGEQFYGREEIIQEILAHHSEQILFLKGIRRIGKTSVLYEVSHRAFKDHETWPILISCDLAKDTESLSKELLYKIKSFLKTNKLEADILHWDQMTVDSLLGTWAEHCAAMGKKTIILMDECEALHQIAPDQLLNIARLAETAAQNMQLVMTGSRNFFRFDGDARPDLLSLTERMRVVDIGRMEKGSVSELVAQQKGKKLVALPDGFVDINYQSCGGHPYLTQSTCFDHFDLTNNKLYAFDMAMVKYELIDVFLANDYGSCTDQQKFVLKSLSTAQGGLTENELQKDWTNNRFVPDTLGELIRLGIIEPIGNDKYDFCAQIFKNWVFYKRYKKTIHVVFHRDDQEQYFEKFKKSMAVYTQTGVVKITTDNDVLATEQKEDGIKRLLNEANAQVFLVSPNLNSDEEINNLHFPYSEELRKKDKPSIPVLLTQGILPLFQETSIGKLKPLPKNAESVDDYNSPNQAWSDISREVKTLLEQI